MTASGDPPDAATRCTPEAVPNENVVVWSPTESRRHRHCTRPAVDGLRLPAADGDFRQANVIGNPNPLTVRREETELGRIAALGDAMAVRLSSARRQRLTVLPSRQL